MQREVGGSDRHKVELSIKKRSKGEEVAILFDPREKGESVVIRRGIRMKYHRQCQQHMFVIRRDEKRKHRDKGMERRDSDEDLFP
jgi:5S rRNA maturation endonuclease (ribonuclease M5)